MMEIYQLRTLLDDEVQDFSRSDLADAIMEMSRLYPTLDEAREAAQNEFLDSLCGDGYGDGDEVEETPPLLEWDEDRANGYWSARNNEYGFTAEISRYSIVDPQNIADEESAPEVP